MAHGAGSSSYVNNNGAAGAWQDGGGSARDAAPTPGGGGSFGGGSDEMQQFFGRTKDIQVSSNGAKGWKVISGDTHIGVDTRARPEHAALDTCMCAGMSAHTHTHTHTHTRARAHTHLQAMMAEIRQRQRELWAMHEQSKTLVRRQDILPHRQRMQVRAAAARRGAVCCLKGACSGMLGVCRLHGAGMTACLVASLVLAVHHHSPT
jgi:hypothetical protein